MFSNNYESRVLLSLMYAVSVYKNLTGGFSNSVDYVKSVHFPLPKLSVIGGILIKSFGVYSLLTGNYTKIALPLLISFTILVTVLFNNPIKSPKKLWMFFALLGVIGGLIMVYKQDSEKKLVNDISIIKKI